MRGGRVSCLLAGLLLCGSALAQSLRIAAPQPGEVIHDNSGRLAVVVIGAPQGAPLQALLDGAPIGAVRSAPAFELEDVPRGVHRLRVAMVDDEGRELLSTEDVEFTLWRAAVGLRPPGPLPKPGEPPKR